MRICLFSLPAVEEPFVSDYVGFFGTVYITKWWVALLIKNTVFILFVVLPLVQKVYCQTKL